MEPLIPNGDVDGDGFIDLVGIAKIGVYDKSAAYQVSGKDGTIICSIPNLPSPVTAITGGGDLNQDGIPDILASRLRASGDSGAISAGRVYGYDGKDCSLLFDIDSDLEQQSGDFGLSIVFAGDVNADGFDDFVVQGRYSGQKYNWMLSGRTQERLFVLVDQNSIGIQETFTPIPDINEDGIDDLLTEGGIVASGKTGK